MILPFVILYVLIKLLPPWQNENAKVVAAEGAD
jgi:hypothetical protein